MSNCLKNWKVIISVVLAILTAIMLPVEVFAQAAPKHNPSAKVKFDSLAESEEVGEIVTEIKERRDEYTKQFRMDDGTIMAVVYDVPVHYKNKKGKWIDYDNTLISKSTASPDEASQVSYSNKKGKIDIDFASETNDAALISLNSSKGNLSWEYVDAKKSNIKIDKSKKMLRGNDRFTSIDKLSSKASYKSIYDKVNLDCIVSTVGVKENIILQDKSAQNEFIIEYNINGFTAKQTDKQTVKLYKGKKEVYSITAPCMYDANKKTSTNLSLKIIGNKAGKLSLKLTADKDFLNNAKYPVTIDPEVSLNGFASTETAYVVDSEPNTVKHQSTTFGVGKSGSAYLSGLVKCKNVSDTFAEKNIVSAKLNIFPMNYSTEMEIDAHQITSSWTNSTATYNNVSYDSEIIDYASTKNQSESEVTFDVTKVFKKWANETLDNNGVYLKSNSDFTNFGGYACYYPSKRPTYVVKYKEYTGLENNLTSHTVQCGRDAGLSVCDYTGSLSVSQSFFEENTARLPLSIFATYHSARNAVNEQTGYGWHYSFNQTISKDNNYYKYIDANGVDHYFKRENNDDNQDEELSDEDDLGLLLKRDHATNQITIDNDSITQTYQIVDNSDIYKLKNEKSNDNENNSISYTYNQSGYLTVITTSLGEYIVTRDSGNYICRINTPDDKRMYFVYYSGTSKIVRFTAVDGKATTFNYESYSDESRLKEIRYHNENGSQTGGGAICNYNDDNKVSSITELGKNGASRTALSVNYPDENRTEFYENGNEDKKETYTFDNYGNTVSVLNANGMITTSNNSSSLSINTGADSYTKNYLGNTNEINSIASSPATEVYYSNAEAIDGVTSDCGTVSIDDTVSYLGSKSIKVKNTGSSQFFTVAKYQKRIEDLAGKTVTLSSYVKLKDIEKGNKTGNWGAVLRIEAYKNPGPKVLDVFSPTIVENLPSSDWQRVSVTATIPEECANYYYEVSFGLRNAQGEAWFDCMQLEKGSVANDYNALSNSDFSSTSNWKTQDDNTITVNDQKAIINGSGGEPSPTEETTSAEPDSTTSTQETTEEPNVETYTAIETETVLNDVVEERNTHGNIVKTEQGFVTRTYKRTYEVNNNATEPEETSTAPESSGDEGNEPQTISCNKYIYQEVPVNKKDVSFVISGSAKANSVPLNSEYRTFGIALKIKYDGDAGYTEDHYQAFNACVDSMQNISLSVTPNDSERVVASVAFAFVYGYNKNKMEIKNAMLNLAYNGVSQEQPSTTETTEPETTEPEATDPPATETTATGTTATEPENNEPSEPGRGELIDEEVQEETINTEQPYMRSENIYETNGNYVATEIDEAGNTTEYERDHDGNVTQLTDGRGNSTSYSYDVHNNLLSVTAVDENTTYSNTYTYNSYNELSKTTHHGFDYNYTYNNYGEPTSVKVGSQALITYTYNNYGNVSNATYGNGYSLDYHYDNYGRITSVTTEANNNTVTLASYKYNKKNQVTKFVDGKSGETTEYCYDCNGNLLYKYLISSGGSLLRVVEGDTEKTTINGSERTITNGTDDDGKSYVQNGKAKITSDTDDFGRTTNVTTKVDNSPKFSVNYSYKNVLDNENNPTHRTTNNVNQMIYKLGNDETPLVEYSYSYDKNGNITEICEGTNTIAEYKYDSLNQIKTSAEINAKNSSGKGGFKEYTYDISGNITTVKEYSLTSGLDKLTDINNDLYYYKETEYKYNDNTWKDLLTKYNNENITYDDIGNPTNYRDGIEMSWSGRELKSLNKSGYTYNFTYNLDGLRTKRIKEQNNTVLETVNYYYDDSNNLIGLKKGETTVLFYYDSEGKVYSMTKGDDTYFFIKDLQGDIRKIIDEDGTVVATYAYDAWGALLAENENSSIEGFNPFRYRSYVYDTETELYYLQSRYYDPKTGRFVNADDPSYTDTGSGSPLSTNMFSYCENNAVNGEDPSGNWVINEKKQKGHPTLTKRFSSTVRNWVKKPDERYGNDEKYSSPFHSRGKGYNPKSLEIAAYLYQKAIKLLDEYNNGNKKTVKFKYKNSINIECLKPFYLGYVNKDKHSPDYKKKTVKLQRAQNLLSDLNALNNKKIQSEAFIGLALHVLQDHFAHLTRADVYQLKKGKNYFIKNMSITKFSNDYVHSTELFEDEPKEIPWRYSNAQAITNYIYACYKGNIYIHSFYTFNIGKRKKYTYTVKKTGITYVLYCTEFKVYRV